MAFEIRWAEEEDVMEMVGRCDAAQAEPLETFLAGVERSATVDMEELAYISSSGLGILFATQKRLMDEGQELRLRKLNPHIREVFTIAGFDTIFTIEEG